MATNEERRKVLQMVEEGKLTPEDGARLLSALGAVEEEAPRAAGVDAPAGGMNGRHFRVRVSNAVTGQQKVSVNIPLGLVDLGLRFVPQSEKFDAAAMREALRSGMTGRIVDVMDDEKGDRVEIFIE